MTRFARALKAGVAGFREATQPTEYSVAGRPVRCPHCENTVFASRRALLNSRVRTAFNIDWADESAWLLVCSACGRIEWFAREPERVAARGSSPAR